MSQTPATRRVSEMEEIRICLRQPPLEENTVTKRSALRKVVALMTSGMDTSGLFPDVIMSCFTSDLICKKMIYLYLTTQSRGKEDLAVLAINALVKECHEQNPLVRGLALRSLSAMHVSSLLEYLIPIVEKAVLDSSAYVRKAAVCSLLRIFYRSPSAYYEMKGFELSLQLLSDPDSHVSASALDALLEVTRREEVLHLESDLHPPLAVHRSLLYPLLNRLRLLSEWQQIQVLQLCLQYTPAIEEEMFEIMNLLDERLDSDHSGVVMACSRVFLHLTQNNPTVQKQVYKRLREPLLMIASSSTTETAYAALCHVKVLVKRDANLFASDHVSFYCDVNEPSCNKCIKMDILAAVVTSHSASSIIEELVAYSEDRCGTVARAAIAAMGSITLKLPDTLSTVIAFFTDFITLGLEDVRGATLSVLTDVLRQHVELSIIRPLLQTVVQCYEDAPFADEESRLALLWLLGEFGEYIADAPYLLELFPPTLLQESASLRMQALTSAVQLFFKRPPETQRCLGRILHTLLNDFTSADVLDKALWYYRLLRTDPALAARVICGPKAPVKSFAEDMDTSMLDRLLTEFDTLSVVYGLPQERFLDEHPRPYRVAGEEEGEEEDDDEDVAEGDGIEETGEVEGEASRSENAGVAIETYGGATLDYLLDLGNGADDLCLSPSAELTPQVFQSKWNSATHSSVFTVLLDNARIDGDTEVIEASLESHNIFVLASGFKEDSRKLFLYAQATAPADAWYLMEALVSPTGTAQMTIKSAEACNLSDFEQLVRRSLSTVR